MSVSKRLGEVLEGTRLPAPELGEMLGCSHQTIHNIKHARYNVSSELLGKFAETFPNISLEWLLTGKGKREKGKLSGFLIENGIKSTLDPDVSDLIIGLYDSINALNKQLEVQGKIISKYISKS